MHAAAVTASAHLEHRPRPPGKTGWRAWWTKLTFPAVKPPPRIHEVPAKLVEAEVLPPVAQPFARPAPPAAAGEAPSIHLLSAVVLLGVDNLWNLPDFFVIDWIITIPLSFLTVFVPVFFIQKKLKRDPALKALGWAALLGVLAAVPFSVTGTVAGSMLLAWLGINQLLGRPRAN